MIVSFSKLFIFIANTKTASNTFESALAAHADIFLSQPEHGKHMGLATVADRYGDLFESHRLAMADFLSFGVIRHPVDWLVSWFNFRSRPALADPAHPRHHAYCGNRTFAEFVDAACTDRPPPFANFGGSQSQLFLDPASSISIDCLIRYHALLRDTDRVAERLGVPELTQTLEAKRINVSTQKRAHSAAINDALRSRIGDRFSDDLSLYDRAPSITDAGFQRWAACRRVLTPPSLNSDRAAAAGYRPAIVKTAMSKALEAERVGDHQAGLRALSAVAPPPSNLAAEYHAQRAHLLTKIGDNRSAADAISRAIEIEPRCDYHRKLSGLLWRLGDADGALHAIELAIQSGHREEYVRHREFLLSKFQN